MTERLTEEIADDVLDEVVGAGDPETNYSDGPKILTHYGWVDGETIVKEIGALMRQGVNAVDAAREVEDKYDHPAR